jgi:putative endonuclease
MPDVDWHVYILQCVDGSLRQHNGELAGGAKYTMGRRPVQVLWSEASPDRGAAQRREHDIKKLVRSEKLALIEGHASR